MWMAGGGGSCTKNDKTTNASSVRESEVATITGRTRLSPSLSEPVHIDEK